MIARAVLAFAMVLAGCVHYPSVEEAGGIHIRPDKGRAVPRPGGYAVYAELRSTGKFGDVLTGATSTVARQAKLVDARGAPAGRVDVPGADVMLLGPNGPHVFLTNLTRALVPGETIIVTLLFEKSGGIGVVTVVE